jgi:hypothetical protein
MTVLILGGADDEHAVRVLHHLRRRGAGAELLDSRGFPAEFAVSLDPSSGAGSFTLPGGRRLPFADVTAVYWRCYNGVGGPDLPNAEQALVAANDARSLFESVLQILPARWVNGWRAFQWHQCKPVQLTKVAALGVPVPATLLGNDPAAVREFAARHPRCIFKPVQGGAHARRLAPEHLTGEHLRHLAYAPVTVQEEVPGTNLRAFVAGRRVLACEVKTGAVDFRDDPAAEIIPCDLPDDVRDWCLRAASELELLWTGIDLRRTPDGRHVFLEANPSPMFLGFEARTGLPLTAALADLLLAAGEPAVSR